MENGKKKNSSNKFLAGLREFRRKFIVKFKKNPSLIPLCMLLISFLVFSLNLTDISNTTAKIQGSGMGLCEFASMLLSILSILCVLNSFPKRQKPNYAMIAIAFLFFAIIITSDIIYINAIISSPQYPPTKTSAFINTAMYVMIAHIILVALTAVCVALEPVFAKLLKKINTTVELDDTKIGDIDLADEE